MKSACPCSRGPAASSREVRRGGDDLTIAHGPGADGSQGRGCQIGAVVLAAGGAATCLMRAGLRSRSAPLPPAAILTGSGRAGDTRPAGRRWPDRFRAPGTVRPGVLTTEPGGVAMESASRAGGGRWIGQRGPAPVAIVAALSGASPKRQAKEGKGKGEGKGKK